MTVAGASRRLPRARARRPGSTDPGLLRNHSQVHARGANSTDRVHGCQTRASDGAGLARGTAPPGGGEFDDLSGPRRAARCGRRVAVDDRREGRAGYPRPRAAEASERVHDLAEGQTEPPPPHQPAQPGRQRAAAGPPRPEPPGSARAGRRRSSSRAAGSPQPALFHQRRDLAPGAGQHTVQRGFGTIRGNGGGYALARRGRGTGSPQRAASVAAALSVSRASASAARTLRALPSRAPTASGRAPGSATTTAGRWKRAPAIVVGEHDVRAPWSDGRPRLEAAAASTWEPESGQFDLDWLEPVLDGAARARHLRHPWHTDVCRAALVGPPVPGDRRRTIHRRTDPLGGSAGEVDFTHPAFLFHADRVIRKILRQAIQGHPAVVGFQVDNEPGLHLLHNRGRLPALRGRPASSRPRRRSPAGTGVVTGGRCPHPRPSAVRRRAGRPGR